MSELENVFTEGTEGIIIDGKLVFIPANEDYSILGKITAYNETIGKVSFCKAWDQATTPETFYALAKYAGRDGTPTAAEVETDSYALFHRVGDNNNNFSSADPGFELDSGDTSKASFVVFFF